MNQTVRITAVFLLALSLFEGAIAHAQATNDGQVETAGDAIRVLIVDGQSGYHGDWPKITFMMKAYLEETGKFKVDVYRSQFLMNGKLEKEFPLKDGKAYVDSDRSKTDPDFKPEFSKYDLVINNFGYDAAPWPEDTKTAFVQYMKNGGGLLSIHSANNCFPDWKEYNMMTGLGGWGGRTQASGPYVYINERGDIVRDNSAGKGGNHGPQHKFQIVLRDREHPITKGMPTGFLHAQDELYEQLRGPGLNMKILATAFASPEQKGSGRHEPLLMVLDYGKGRVFHTTLGHAAYSCECVGFITTFLRGAEWAATGNVTISIPDDFPTAKQLSVRKFDERAKTLPK